MSSLRDELDTVRAQIDALLATRPGTDFGPAAAARYRRLCARESWLLDQVRTDGEVLTRMSLLLGQPSQLWH